MHSYRLHSWRPGAKPAREERKDFVACDDRRLAGLVNEVGGHHAVRTRHVVGKERRDIRVGRAVGKNASDKALSERLAISGEALRSAEPIALESIGQHAEVFALEPLAHLSELFRRDLDAA